MPSEMQCTVVINDDGTYTTEKRRRRMYYKGDKKMIHQKLLTEKMKSAKVVLKKW